MFYKYFQIQTKSQGKQRFIPNKVQLHFKKHKTNKNRILKARQLGLSTIIKLEDLETILTKKNVRCITIADTNEHAETLLDIVNFAFSNLPPEIRILYKEQYRSKRQLFLAERNSGIKITTSGRSGTAQRLHVSEWAFFTEKQIQETIGGTMQSVPNDGEITCETTACGMNHFQEEWEKSEEQGYSKFFYNWTWANEYQSTPPNLNFKKKYKELAYGYKLIENPQERFNLSDEQFYWYFLKTLQIKELVKQEYPFTAEEAFLTTGIAVFDLEKISQIITSPPLNTFKDVVELWELPKDNHKYVIGMDTAEGVEQDNSALEIIDITDMNQVGEFASNIIEPHEFAELGVQLGKLYNNAYIVAERNASGLTTVTKIKESNYPRIYISRTIDKITKKVKNEYGWRTTSTNRDLLIDEILEAIHEGRLGIKSAKLISEMKTFVRKRSGKREHDEGKKDDRLFALMLAFQGIKTYSSILDFLK